MATRAMSNTWWGQAWITALEQRARLDPNRLPRGRTYARTGRVRALELVPGRISAAVRGSRPQPYAVAVDLRQFTDDEWTRLLDAVAARAGHAAALLDGALDPAVVEDAAAAGVALLPGPGELTPRCSCPDWADPCKHSAAVCYLMAGELDHDPFSLLLLRGRTRDQVLAELRQRRAGSSSSAATAAAGAAAERAVDPGVLARDAWERPLGPLPAPPSRRDHAGHALPYAAEPPAHLGVTAASLSGLVDDAARRAFALLRGEASSGLGEDATVDLARRAADSTPERLTELADRAGRRPRDLAADAVAYAQAGPAGVRAVHELPWTPPLARMAAGRDAVIASGSAPTQVRVRNNTITVAGRTQIRLCRDGLWYRLDKQGGRWELTAPAAEEPDDLVFRRSHSDEDDDDD